MAESSLLRCALLLILVVYFLCSLSSGQSQTVTCNYNRSSLIPGQFLLVNITGQPCRGGAIRTLRFCFLEADSNLTQIRYRLLTNITQLSFPPPYTGFIGTVTLCGNLDSLCCSMASIGDFNSIIYFQMIAFGSIGGLEYLKTNFQSLQLSVIFREQGDTTDVTSIIENLAPSKIDLLAVYITVPLSLLLVVGFFIPCLYFIIQSKRRKELLQRGTYYIYEDGGKRRPVVVINDSHHPAAIDHHYSYIRQEEVSYYSISPPRANHLPSRLYEYSYYSSGDELSVFNIPECSEDALYHQLSDISVINLNREDINILSELGSGQFGKVYNGVWSSPRGDVEVAIKTLKEDSKEKDRVKFLQEAAIMGQFKHSSIVTMHGIVTEGQPSLLVLELLAKGDLRNHLISARSESDSDIMNPHTLLSYSRQVVCGMNYLANKHFIHRDLAARNILVSVDEICKIADFGMSRDLLYQETYESHGGMIPVKWTAPEALFYKTYSTASDVWSYGILLYEIWSIGHKPYEELKNSEILPLLESGKRLPPPPGCPRAIYNIMIDCWHSDSSVRPTFENLTQTLSASDLKLLKWLKTDKLIHPEATALGANLSCAASLYSDLQETYHKPNDPQLS